MRMHPRACASAGVAESLAPGPHHGMVWSQAGYSTPFCTPAGKPSKPSASWRADILGRSVMRLLTA